MSIRIPKARHGGRGFTLVELLVVIAIMGIMLAVALPAFNTMGRGGGLRSATMQMRAVLTFARQWAITHNETTYVVFPDNTVGLFSGSYTSQVDKAYRACVVYTKSEGYVRDWVYLPQGVVFVSSQADFNNSPDVNPDKCIFDPKTPAVKTALVGCPEPNNLKTVPVIGFRPDGSMTPATGNMTLYMSEGTVPPSGGTTANKPVYRTAGQRVLVGIDIYPLTGQMRVWRYEKGA